MTKKIPLLFLTLFIIVLAGAVRQAFADAAELMEQADRLNVGHFYYQAEQLYQSIVADYPDTDYALIAQRKLVCVLIAAEKSPEQVDAEFNKLTTDFANNEQLPAQIHQIGTNCRYGDNYQQAKYYYNYVIENFPDNPQAILSQKDIVKAAIEAEDYTAEQQALDELKSKFANHPNLAKSLCSVADCYIGEKKYDKANELNKYIVSNFPESDEALRAQKNLVKSYIAYNDDPNTETSMEKLSTDFANHPGQSAALRSIAVEYRDEGRYDKAIELYESLIETYPNDQDKIHCQKGLAVSNIWHNEDVNDPNTKAAIEALVTDFNSHSDFLYTVFRIGEEYYKKAQKLSKDSTDETAGSYFSKAIEQWQLISQLPPINGFTDKVHYRMAECYMYIDDYDNAMVHYRKVVDDWPESKYKMGAQKYLAIANINVADDPNAMAQVEQLIADFNDSPFLPRIVFHIGEEYFFIAENYYKDRQMAEAVPLYQKALNIWEMVIDREDLDTFRCGQVYTFSAFCYERLGEYIKATDYFQKVANDWPGYKYVIVTLPMVAQCYEKLRRSPDVAMSADEADIRIEAAYLAVIEKYPEKPSGVRALMKLGRFYFERQRWTEAIVYFEMYQQKRPDHYGLLYMLGQAYEKMGDNELAIAIYEEYLAKAREDDQRIELVEARLAELKGDQ